MRVDRTAVLGVVAAWAERNYNCLSSDRIEDDLRADAADVDAVLQDAVRDGLLSIIHEDENGYRSYALTDAGRRFVAELQRASE